jgi:hypothetical protein
MVILFKSRKSMSQLTPFGDRDRFLETLAAELTIAAYTTVLRHGVREHWLDLELDLWHAMTEMVRRLEREEGVSQSC